MGRLDGKRALISGTGGGIGRAAALACAREGAHVVGCDLNPETSAETVELVRAEGGRMDAIAPVDLATEEGAGRWVQEAVTLTGGIDVLVNNASAIRFGPIDALSFADWSFTIRHELDVVSWSPGPPGRTWWRAAAGRSSTSPRSRPHVARSSCRRTRTARPRAAFWR